MQGKIEDRILNNLSANFFPEYPVNGWPIFQGLFNTQYTALDDLCEFKATNVFQWSREESQGHPPNSYEVSFQDRLDYLVNCVGLNPGKRNRNSENPKRHPRNMIKNKKDKFSTPIRRKDKLRPSEIRLG